MSLSKCSVLDQRRAIFFFLGGVGGVGEEGVDNSLPTLKWNVVFLNLKKKTFSSIASLPHNFYF